MALLSAICCQSLASKRECGLVKGFAAHLVLVLSSSQQQWMPAKLIADECDCLQTGIPRGAGWRIGDFEACGNWCEKHTAEGMWDVGGWKCQEDKNGKQKADSLRYSGCPKTFPIAPYRTQGSAGVTKAACAWIRHDYRAQPRSYRPVTIGSRLPRIMSRPRMPEPLLYLLACSASSEVSCTSLADCLSRIAPSHARWCRPLC